MLSASPQQEGDGLGVLAAGDEGELILSELADLQIAGGAQFVGGELLDLSHHSGTGGLGELHHVGLLDATDREDAFLAKEVLGQVVDALLHEHRVGARGLDGLDHLAQHVLLLGQESGHLGGVGDLDLGVDLGLLDLDGRIEQGDLGVLHPLGHGRVHRLLVDDDSLDELGVVHGGAGLLDDLDVVHVDVPLVSVLLGDGGDGINGQISETLAGAADGLGDHRGAGNELEGLLVVDAHGSGHRVQDLLGLDGGEPVAAGDDSGVDVGFDQVNGLLQQLPGQDDRAGGPVPGLLVLRLGDLHQHLGGGVVDIDLLQDGDAVVGDDNIAKGVYQHLVHSTGPKGAADRVGDGLGGLDVVVLRVLTLIPLGTFLQDEYRCISHSHVFTSNVKSYPASI